MFRIFLSSEGGHFTAWLEKRPEISGIGSTADEAVGNPISLHSQRFNIEIKENP